MLGYAVIDTETTGLNIWGNDKIIEIAVVLLDMDLNITATYETILNPQRDLGLVSLHGIDGIIAAEGAFFRNIMPSLSTLLQNRVIVGHNVQFDIRILEGEYKKEVAAPDFGVSLDTLQLAKSLSLHLPSYRLGALCEHFGIPLKDAHTAMADTIATAKLLMTMAEQYDLNVTCQPADFGSIAMVDEFKEWKPRHEIIEFVSQPADLKKHIEVLPDDIKELPESSVETYLKTLHLASLNGRYSLWERAKMEETITELSLTRSQVIDLNEEYIFFLICKNLHENNGEWVQSTNTERIRMVQEFTGVEDERVEWLLQETLVNRHLIQPAAEKINGYVNFAPGDTFVVTGEDLNPSKEYWEELLGDLGFISRSDTTKKTKLVIAADPYSLSSKAVKARKYGIPVITEDTLAELLKL